MSFIRFLAKRRHNNIDWVTVLVAYYSIPTIGWWFLLVCVIGAGLSVWAEHATGEA